VFAAIVFSVLLGWLSWGNKELRSYWRYFDRGRVIAKVDSLVRSGDSMPTRGVNKLGETEEATVYHRI
jgi:hypothetical protein